MYLGSNVEMGLRKGHRNSNDSFSQIRGKKKKKRKWVIKALHQGLFIYAKPVMK
jgi:hypothetical protein